MSGPSMRINWSSSRSARLVPWLSDEPVFAFFFGGLDHVTHKPPITSQIDPPLRTPRTIEPLALAQPGARGHQLLIRRIREFRIAAARDHPPNISQLDRTIGLEPDPFGEPRRQPLIRGQEPINLRVIAGDDHHQPIPIILHPRQQRIHRLAAERIPTRQTGLNQRIRLIDEQHPIHRRINQRTGLDRRRPQMLTHKILPLRLHHRRRLQQPQPAIGLSHHPRDRGLTRPRRTSKRQMQTPRRRTQPLIPAHLGQRRRRPQLGHLLLNLAQPDLLIQLQLRRPQILITLLRQRIPSQILARWAHWPDPTDRSANQSPPSR